jgi:hypothetical protein
MPGNIMMAPASRNTLTGILPGHSMTAAASQLHTSLQPFQGQSIELAVSVELRSLITRVTLLLVSKHYVGGTTFCKPQAKP